MRAAWILASGLLCVASACTHPALARFSNEYDCPTDRASITDLGAFSYRVSGCQHEIIGAAGELESVRDVLEGVVDGGVSEVEPGVDAGVERPVLPEPHAVA